MKVNKRIATTHAHRLIAYLAQRADALGWVDEYFSFSLACSAERQPASRANLRLAFEKTLRHHWTLADADPQHDPEFHKAIVDNLNHAFADVRRRLTPVHAGDRPALLREIDRGSMLLAVDLKARHDAAFAVRSALFAAYTGTTHPDERKELPPHDSDQS